MRQIQVEASEKVREASQNAGGTSRASIRKAPPSIVLQQQGAAAAGVGMPGRRPTGGAEPDTSAAPQVCVHVLR